MAMTEPMSSNLGNEILDNGATRDLQTTNVHITLSTIDLMYAAAAYASSLASQKM